MVTVLSALYHASFLKSRLIVAAFLTHFFVAWIYIMKYFGLVATCLSLTTTFRLQPGSHALPGSVLISTLRNPACLSSTIGRLAQQSQA